MNRGLAKDRRSRATINAAKAICPYDFTDQVLFIDR